MSVAPVLAFVLLAAACSKPDAAASPPPPASAAKAPAASVPASPRPGFAKRRTLSAQARIAAASGDWETCGRLFESAHAWSDAARCIVHTKDTGRALDDLQHAIARGTVELDKLQADPELAPLAHDPRWRPLIAEATARQAAYRGSLNAELEQLVHADPAGTEAYVFASRRGRVREILAAGGATVADDYVHAAAIYYRADTADDAIRARELALIALERDPDSDEARWLAAASEDRRLKHEGKPQKYGTQFATAGGKRVLWNIDPAISDAERARWSVPSLAEAIAGDAETTGAVHAGAPTL
ncbi:MAG: hypothetical protein ABIY55_28500 [Kofleriaceae bacterium]